MTSFLLVFLTLSSFLFYGVVGQDKTWVLAPVYLFSYAAITVALLKRAWCMGQGAGRDAQGERRMGQGDKLQTSIFKLPTSAALWLLFLLWGIMMIPSATVPYEAKLRMLFIGAVIGAYLVWGAELTAFKDNRLLLGFLLFIVLLMAMYGLINFYRQPSMVLWVERYAPYGGRLASTYICPNHFAHLMQMLMPFCLALLFIPQGGIFLRLLAGYSLAAFLPPLFLTESRAGWLGAIAAVGVTVCLIALRRSKKLFVLLVILVPLCSTLLLLAGWRFSETFQRRARPVVQFLQGQAKDGIGSEARDFRPQTWMDTVDMIREAPLIGFGPGNYRYTYPENRKRFKGSRIVTGHPHNEYLELIADFGLIGFGLFALAWCYGLLRILKASLKAGETRHAFIGFAFLGTAAGTMVHSFFDFEMHVFPNAMVFALLGAIAVAPLFSVRRKQQRSLKSSKSLNVKSEEYLSTDIDPARRRAEGARGKAALECGGKQRATPLSELDGHKKHRNPHNKSGSSLNNSAGVVLRFSWLKNTAAWLLAIGYLLMAVLCVQTMSSAYIRALADKAASSPRHTPEVIARAQRLYASAAKMDAGNWRAYKGMADLVFHERYYSLDWEEKVRLAKEEAGWNSRAYELNPKDPEICSAYGKALLFLAKAGSRESGGRSLGMGVSESGGAGGEAALECDGKQRATPLSRSEDGGQKTDDGRLRADDEGPRSDASNSKLPESEAIDNFREKIETTGNGSTPNSLQTRGLELLREACIYRPFNDVYWWSLGVELRKQGRYEEALEVFSKALSIKRTPSTVANIKWIEGRLSGDSGQKATDAAESREPVPVDWEITDPLNVDADTGLQNLLDRMDREKNK